MGYEGVFTACRLIMFNVTLKHSRFVFYLDKVDAGRNAEATARVMRTRMATYCILD